MNWKILVFDGVTAAGNEQHLVHLKLEGHVMKTQLLVE
jgi:hypothetical protein